MKKLLMLLITLVVAVSLCAADQYDVVNLKNGSKIIGTIIEQIPNQSLRIRTRDGSEFVYTFDQIASITKEGLDFGPRDIRNESYFELGANLGTPAGLNFTLGNWFGPLGLHISGMSYGDRISGIQANFGFKLSDNTNRSHSIAFICGHSNADINTWSYYGAAYDLNWGGFFLEAGLTAGSGSYTNPQLALQIGYTYRFL